MIGEDYHKIRKECPVCGYKFATFESYLSYIDGKTYMVKRVRCPKNIINKAITSNKKRVGGCGKITVISKRKKEKGR